MSSRFGRSPVQAFASVTTSFQELLAAAGDGARQLEGEGVLSLALPLPAQDPLALLSHLEEGERFRFLWDSAPGLCLAASGRTNSLELSGPRRFELAQRFSAVSLSRLAAPQACPPLARPRVLLAFAFFDSPLQEGEGVPGVQAVLPRWQLSRQGRHCWLRLQRSLGGEVTARSLAEELWEQAERLARLAAADDDDPSHSAAAADIPPAILHRSAWQQGYRSVVERGLELVESNRLRKLVLAVRQELLLDRPLEPQHLLRQLRVLSAEPWRLERRVLLTRRAAELQDRVLGAADLQSPEGRARAAQSSVRVLREHIEQLGYRKNFSIAGEGDVYVAGGLESISCVQLELNAHMVKDPWLLANKPTVFDSMLQTAENVAKRYDISRDRQDEYGARSQQRACAAQAAGHLDAEIAPIKVKTATVDNALLNSMKKMYGFLSRFPVGLGGGSASVCSAGVLPGVLLRFRIWMTTTMAPAMPAAASQIMLAVPICETIHGVANPPATMTIHSPEPISGNNRFDCRTSQSVPASAQKPMLVTKKMISNNSDAITTTQPASVDISSSRVVTRYTSSIRKLPVINERKENFCSIRR